MAGGRTESDAGFCVDVVLDDRSRKCRSQAELLALVRDLDDELQRIIGERKSLQQTERDARLRLGAALRIVRDSVVHGGWAAFLGRCGINRKTAHACMRLAELVADEKGRLDQARTNAASNVHHGGHLKVAAHELTTRQLEQAVGLRPVDAAANRFLVKTDGSPVVAVPARDPRIAARPPGVAGSDEPLFHDEDGGADLGDAEGFGDDEPDDGQDEEIGGGEGDDPETEAAMATTSGAVAEKGGRKHVQLHLTELYAAVETARDVAARVERAMPSLTTAQRTALEAEYERSNAAVRDILGDPA